MANRLTDEFKVSASAVDKLSDLVSSEENEAIKGVRIFVSGSGCSGTQYGMTFADSIEDDDGVLEFDKLAVYVDSQCLATMEGIEIDFQDGPNGPSFAFNNTKAPQSSCGTCGSAGGSCG